jgi:CheY-like chemotaxis protein
MVVEDNPFVRTLIRNVLQDAGMEVTEAENLATAQRLIPHSQADALVADFHLRDETALEVWAFAMRANYHLAKKMLILADELTPQEQEAIEYFSGLTVLAKRSIADELVNAVKKLLE